MRPRADALLVAGLTLVTVALVGFPVVWLLLGSLGMPETLGLAPLRYVLGDGGNRSALLNTIELGAGTAVTSALLGVPLAWLAARTDIPGKRVIDAGAALAYMLPPYLTSLAYIALAAPRSGYLNRIIVAASGLSHGPFNAFSMAGVIAVVSLHTFPFVYFQTTGALRSVGGSYEESARILGASPLRAARTVTLPLVAPAITAGMVLAGTVSTALFGPQAFLGVPARLEFLPTRIYGELQTYPPRFADASALAMLLVILALLGLAVQRSTLHRGSFATIGGKVTAAPILRLGAWRVGAVALCASVLGAGVVLPVGLLAALSMSRDWITTLGPSGWTLTNYAYALFTEPASQRGLANSLRLALGTATIGTALGFLIAYADRRTQVRGRAALDYLAGVPLGLPGIVIALGMLQGWVRVPFPVYGTIWILLIAYLVHFLPRAVRSTSAALAQVDVSLEEAGRITGAGWGRVTRTISLPLARPGLLAAWIFVFVPAFGDLSTAILLYSQGNETLSVAIYHLESLGRLEVVAALAVVGLAVSALVVAIAAKVSGRNVFESAAT
jgi:iron(III) transport system permease protein